jgi:hypothetical protein
MTPTALRNLLKQINDWTEGGNRLSLFLTNGTRFTGVIHQYGDEECVAIDVDRINGKDLAPEAECLPAWVKVSTIAAVMVEG